VAGILSRASTSTPCTAIFDMISSYSTTVHFFEE